MLNAEILRKRKKKKLKKKNLFTKTNVNILPDLNELKHTLKIKFNTNNSNEAFKINDSNLPMMSHDDISVNNVVMYDVYRNESTLLKSESSESIIHPVQKTQISKCKKRKLRKKNLIKNNNQLQSTDELLPITRKEQFQNCQLISDNHVGDVIKNLNNSTELKSLKHPKTIQQSSLKFPRNSKKTNLEIACVSSKPIIIYESGISIKEFKKNVADQKRYLKESEIVNIKQHLKATLKKENRFTLQPKEYNLLGQIWKNTAQC